MAGPNSGPFGPRSDRSAAGTTGQLHGAASRSILGAEVGIGLASLSTRHVPYQGGLLPLGIDQRAVTIRASCASKGIEAFVFAFLDRGRQRRRCAVALYDQLVEQARQPVFYAEFGVPDTLDGRFEMIVLHTVLVLDRLRGQGDAAKGFSQILFDHMLADFDSGLRIVGVADLRVAGKLKQMAKAYYGRALAYSEGLKQGDAALQAALSRNLYGTIDTEPPQGWLQTMASYCYATANSLADQSVDALLAGRIVFPNPPAVKDGQ